MLRSSKCFDVFGNPKEENNMILWDIPKELEFKILPNRIYCNKTFIEPFRKALQSLSLTGYDKELKTYDGCFNIRQMKGVANFSLHSWGVAIDLNATWNGYGKKPSFSKEFVKCFTDNGFDWGGVWSIPDGMHFQLKEEMI